MKKFFLFLSTVMISSMIYSQESKMAIGFQLAPSITSIRGNTLIDEYDSRYVVSPGITFDYNISKNFSFVSGLAFERKGAKTGSIYIDISGLPVGNRELKINFDYLTMPLMFIYNTNGKVNFYIGGGTFLGYLLSNKYTLSKIDHFFPQQTHDFTNITKRFDTGLSVTAGINIPMTDKLILELGLRDYLGLVNVSKYEIADDGSIKTNSFSLVLGLKHKI